MSTRRGGALELAISRAGRDYRHAGRACIVRQSPPIANYNNGIIFSGTAPIDFLGTLPGGQLIAIEAKETRTASLPLSRIRDDQRELMRALHTLGGDVHLVVDFSEVLEVFAIGWSVVAAFIAAPARQSLSLTWCRCNGLLLPEENTDDSTRRRVLFLDGAPHPGAEYAREELAVLEQRKASAPFSIDRPGDRLVINKDQDVIEELLSEGDRASIDFPSVPLRLTAEQRRDRIINATQAGIDNQLRRPRRTFQRRRP